jgi:hypothetical protein
MKFVISGDFWDFLELLSKKKDGDPLCFYQRDIDFLYIICGEGFCSDWGRLSTGKMIFKGVDIIEKMYPEDCVNGDTFAGLEIWGGVGNFVSHNYRNSLGHRYEAYRREHNAHRWPTAISEIIEFLENDSRGLAKPRWSEWREKVLFILSAKQPMVHIPLMPL